jgi:hypothetical protein
MTTLPACVHIAGGGFCADVTFHGTPWFAAVPTQAVPAAPTASDDDDDD